MKKKVKKKGSIKLKLSAMPSEITTELELARLHLGTIILFGYKQTHVEGIVKFLNKYAKKNKKNEILITPSIGG